MTCTLSEGCINKNEVTTGYLHCPNQRVLLTNLGRVNIHRLNNITQCNDLGFPECDTSTCFSSHFSHCIGDYCSTTQVLCTSYCDDAEKCNGIFQCSDNSLILFSKFCDGIVDCEDGSDEITNHQGFKCNKCVLPQNNLYDNIAHCNDSSDLCLDDNNACFECFDKRLLISSNQVCNGVSDCYDMSDECLCEKYFETEMCKSVFKTNAFQCFSDNTQQLNALINTTNTTTADLNNPFVKCHTKYKSLIVAIACDGRPECKDYSDECHCANPPLFCNDTCHHSFLMGDRYCDGVEDQAWGFINNSACPQGFDEMFCPKRFNCSANGKVSIDVLQVCDGKADCDDEEDERSCPSPLNIQRIFSSDAEMIDNSGLKAAFWIIGFVVLLGNAYVVVTTILFLKKHKKLDKIGFQHFIKLNISIADFIMGIYLITIAIYSALFSGYYGEVDKKWRSSLKCSVIGSLAVVSSESSCFLMVVLTAFRLVNITNPIGSLTFSLRPWKISLGLSWLFSFILGIVPTLNVAFQYFVHSFSCSSKFQNEEWSVANLKDFVCRLVELSNSTLKATSNEFQSLQNYLESSLPEEVSVNLFGYYGATSVCMPRFYVARGESSWIYTLAVITLNFLCFLFIAVSYFVIYKQSSKPSPNLRNNKSIKQAATMQKRIARIIATDFFCWIPICIMAYLRLGIDFSNIVYQISAVILLPINSALNPFLFSSLPDKLVSLFRLKLQNMIKSTSKN